MMNRQGMLQQLKEGPLWDIIIIGGGATGLGAAIDSASRGYKTLLVEQSDFAKGTSSRSTKLVHGGVRYLAQGNIKLVREALKERGLLLKNAPHVCHNLPFVIPSYHWWQKWYYATGLFGYDLLSGKYSLGKPALLSQAGTRSLLPGISLKGLNGGVLYHDGQFDDARLAVNLAQTAAEQGGSLINYCKVLRLTKTDHRISGVVVMDVLSGNTYNLRSKSVINATGIFTDEVMRLDDEGHKPVVSLSQGVHIVVDKNKFPGDAALMIPETDDGRVLFAVPWHNKIVLGTTDTPVNDLSSDPVPLPEEVAFIIKHINRYLAAPIQPGDIRSVYAGLRPLIKVSGQKMTSILPRDHTTIISASGLVTITGGKWTTYRRMGKHAVDSAVLNAGLEKKRCTTESLKIHGYDINSDKDDALSVYGSDAASIKQLMADNVHLKEKIHQRLPYVKAQVIWAVQQEMGVTVEDILARRTRALFLDAAAAIEAAPDVASLMAGVMQKDKDWEAKQVADFNTVAETYLLH